MGMVDFQRQFCGEHLSLRDFDRAFGRHSGIPECCVNFFVSKNIPELMEWNKKSKKDNAKYVRCPQCIETNHVVKLLQCSRDCWFLAMIEAKNFQNMKIRPATGCPTEPML